MQMQEAAGVVTNGLSGFSSKVRLRASDHHTYNGIRSRSVFCSQTCVATYSRASRNLTFVQSPCTL